MKRKRVLISGFEIGGQMQLLAQEFRNQGVECMAVAFNNDFRKFKLDKTIDTKRKLGIVRQLVFFSIALFKYDIFYFFWGVSLLSIWKFKNIDLPLLKFFGKKILVHFRGTDVINLNYYVNLRAEQTGEELDKSIPLIKEEQKRKINRFKKYSDYILVSTPDLLFIDERAQLFPQVIKISEWKIKNNGVVPRDQEKSVYRIAHAPTRRNTKGTDIIIESIRNLKSKGVPVELCLIENVPYDQMKDMLIDCDFGIDQLFHGWYGKISVELIALGKPVICYISDRYANLAGLNPPLIHTTAKTLEDTIQNVIENFPYYHENAKDAEEFIAKYHNVELEIRKLKGMLQLYPIAIGMRKIRNIAQ